MKTGSFSASLLFNHLTHRLFAILHYSNSCEYRVPLCLMKTHILHNLLLVDMVVVLPDPFRGMKTRRNFVESQQLGHAPRSGPEVKNGSSAKDGALERLRCGTIQKEVT